MRRRAAPEADSAGCTASLPPAFECFAPAPRDADVAEEHRRELPPELVVGQRAAGGLGLLDQDVVVHECEGGLHGEVDGERRIGMVHLAATGEQQPPDALLDPTAETQPPLTNGGV